eukprot:SAG31_NODE_13887_length_839_cov_1.544595_2_plen_98_part_00
MLASKQSFVLRQSFSGGNAELVELVQQFIHVRCVGVTWDQNLGDAIFVGVTPGTAANVLVLVVIAKMSNSGEITVSSTDAMLANRLAAEFATLCAEL